MSSSEQIVLIDLPSVPPCKTWSLNPWKTRFLLNYKGLDYQTEWVEYPDVKPRLEGHVEPNKEGWQYTSPTIILPDGTYVMESKEIAKEIEKRYPEPTVNLDAPQLAKLEKLIPQIQASIPGVYVPKVVKRLLNEASHEYWYKTREAKMGMPLDQLEREKGGQDAWHAAKPHLDEITAMLKEDSSGPYFLGRQVSYVDFVWGGFLIFMQRIGSDVWEALLKTVGEDADVHGKLLLGLDQWSLRNDR